MPILVGSDGITRVCDLSLAFWSTPVARETAIELRSPGLLPTREATLLRARMLRGLVSGGGGSSGGGAGGDGSGSGPRGRDAEGALSHRVLTLLGRFADNTALRAVVTAIAFRDAVAARFWRIAAAATAADDVAPVAAAAAAAPAPRAALVLPSHYALCQPVSDVLRAERRFLNLVAFADDAASRCGGGGGDACDGCAPTRLRSELMHGLLRLGDRATAVALMLDRRRPAAGVRSWGGGAGSGARAAAESYEMVEPACVTMSSWLRLKACVVAAACGADAFEDAIAHVASDLLDDQLDEAIDLMCVVGRAFEACLVLQQSHKWRRAAVIARTALPLERCGQIWERWADHLAAGGHLSAAAEALAATARWRPLIEMLAERGDAEGVERAALLADWRSGAAAGGAGDAEERSRALSSLGVDAAMAGEYDKYLAAIGSRSS